jgi:hypothetical protein
MGRPKYQTITTMASRSKMLRLRRVGFFFDSADCPRRSGMTPLGAARLPLRSQRA